MEMVPWFLWMGIGGCTSCVCVMDTIRLWVLSKVSEGVELSWGLVWDIMSDKDEEEILCISGV